MADQFLKGLPLWGGMVKATQPLHLYDPATDLDYKFFSDQLPTGLSDPLRYNANRLRGASKIVDYLQRLSFVPAWVVCRDELAPESLVVGTRCLVHNPATAAELGQGLSRPAAVFVLAENAASGTELAYWNAGGSPLDVAGADKVLCDWVAESSIEAQLAQFETFDPSPTNSAGAPRSYPQGRTVKAPVSGSLRLFEAIVEVVPAGLPLLIPAPTGLPGDANWREISPPGSLSEQYFAISVAAARYAVDEDNVRAVRYRILRPPGSGDVELFGLPGSADGGPSSFSPNGWWEQSPGAWVWASYNLSTDMATVFSSGSAVNLVQNLSSPNAGDVVSTAGVATALAAKQDLTGYHGIRTGGPTVIVGTGSRSTTISTGLLYRPGDAVRLDSVSGNGYWVAGTVTSYDSSTGALVFTATSFNGTGSISGAAKVAPFVPASTTQLAEGSNLYFTVARVLATVLTGFAAATGTVAATDTVLQALQKLAWFANNLLSTAQMVSGIWNFQNGLKLANGTTITASYDVYDVSPAKRAAVVAANNKAVVETDAAFFGKKFVDEVSVPGSITRYCCEVSVQADASTVWKWFRSVIQ